MGLLKTFSVFKPLYKPIYELLLTVKDLTMTKRKMNIPEIIKRECLALVHCMSFIIC